MSWKHWALLSVCCAAGVSAILLGCGSDSGTGRDATKLLIGEAELDEPVERTALGSGRVTAVVPTDGGCVSVAGGSVQHWNVQEGKTYLVTLSDVKECDGDTMKVLVKNSGVGNQCRTATRTGDGVYQFTITMGPPACNTYPIQYCTDDCDPSTGSFARRSDGGDFQAHLRASIWGAGCTWQGEDEDCTNCPSNPVCTFDAPAVAGVLTGTITGGTPPYQFAAAPSGTTGWIVDSYSVDNNVSPATFQINYSVNHDFNPVCPGVFSASFVDANLCPGDACNISVPCVIACAVSGPTLICPGGTATICVEPVPPAIPPFTYSWTGPGNFASSDACITVSTPGIYSATVTDGNGFTSPGCCHPVVGLSIDGPGTVCAGTPSRTYTANVEGGTFTGVFSWTITSGDALFCDGTTATTGNPVCVNVGNGPFSLCVRASGTVAECLGTPVVGECCRTIQVPACGYTLGYWSNPNGRATLCANDPAWRTLLNGLCLRKADGGSYAVPLLPTTCTNAHTSFRTWLLAAESTNMAYMLSAQLAATTLNVNYKGLSDAANVVLPANLAACYGAATANIGAVRNEAKQQLCDHPYTPSGDPNRARQTCLKDILDGINNNAFLFAP